MKNDGELYKCGEESEDVAAGDVTYCLQLDLEHSRFEDNILKYSKYQGYKGFNTAVFLILDNLRSFFRKTVPIYLVYSHQNFR